MQSEEGTSEATVTNVFLYNLPEALAIALFAPARTERRKLIFLPNQLTILPCFTDLSADLSKKLTKKLKYVYFRQLRWGDRCQFFFVYQNQIKRNSNQCQLADCPGKT